MKLVEGNDKRKKGGAPQFKVGSRLPYCPKDLKGAGRRMWRRLTPILHEQGLLNVSNIEVFEQMCRAYWASVTADTQTARNAAAALHKQIAIEFGLTPRSAGGVVVPPKKEKSILDRARGE